MAFKEKYASSEPDTNAETMRHASATIDAIIEAVVGWFTVIMECADDISAGINVKMHDKGSGSKILFIS